MPYIHRTVSPKSNNVSVDNNTKYRLQVTAGPEYDSACHSIVPVNQQETVTFENDLAFVSLCVRVKNYRGYPEGSPNTHAYFSYPLHKSQEYSVTFSFQPKKAISGDSLVFGNDFDNPIRDRLLPGFSTALRIVRWMIDPGLYGNAYTDKPYLYGPALSSLNCLRICGRPGSKNWREELHTEVIEEGGEAEGEVSRQEMNIPDQAHERQKHFLQRENRQTFCFEPGVVYKADFGNGYIDFQNFSLKLPGFSIPVIQYVNDKNHNLRYVLKDRHSGEVIFALVFKLIFEG
ncbi:hypothetical protein N7499_008764 [Penicillium canescens]|nr:hypothetical protein N7499_008764 [Penicillium canescens]KAJ6159092.1 hypothetical protein N7485_011918 [Penicillium canescens]